MASFLSDLYTKSESTHGQNDNEGADGVEEGEEKEEEEWGREGSWESYQSQSRFQLSSHNLSPPLFVAPGWAPPRCASSVCTSSQSILHFNSLN